MFQTGDLLWIPQGSIALSHSPDKVDAYKKIEKPSIGLYVSKSRDDSNFSIVMLDGREWAIKNKNIMHYRRKHASQTNRSI